MNIYRVTVESIKADDPAAAVQELAALRDRIRSVPGMIVYPDNPLPEQTWGVPLRGWPALQCDFDVDNHAEDAIDAAAMTCIEDFLTGKAWSAETPPA